jgi:hypothetical protein
MEYRLSNLLTVLVVVFFYSGGQPAFYFVAFLNLLVSYWADKIFIFKNFYKLPHFFEGELIIMIQSLANFCLLAHIIGRALVFANSAIMQGEFKQGGYTLESLTEPPQMKIFWIAQAGVALLMLVLYILYPHIVKRCKLQGS